MIDGNLDKLEKEVWAYVETLRDSPPARLQSREAFYLKYGLGNKKEKYGYGDSEIAFMRWEERGVLKPSWAKPPGSAWWSEVNLWFIFLSELGKHAYETGFPKSVLPGPAQFWIEFIENPGAESWYRAHNASIIDGYIKYPHLAAKENVPEIIFINMVLYRLLYAQSMVEGKTLFPKLFKILGNPRGSAVGIITQMDAFYPEHYPLSDKDIHEIMGNAHNLGELAVEILDDVLIEPELTILYEEASVWNKQEELKKLIHHHKPAYPEGIVLPDTHKGWFIRILAWIRKLLLKIK